MYGALRPVFRAYIAARGRRPGCRLLLVRCYPAVRAASMIDGRARRCPQCRLGKGRSMPVARRLSARLRSSRAPLRMQRFEGYNDYWDARGGEPIIDPRWQIAASMIPDRATVLDVGWGAGGFLAYLTSQRPTSGPGATTSRPRPSSGLAGSDWTRSGPT